MGIGRTTMLLAFVTLAVTLASPTEQPDPTLSLQVSDPSGAVIPDVKVVVHSQSPLTSQTVETNPYGKASMSLPSGHYDVVVEATGFVTWRKPVDLTTQAPVDLQVVLKVVGGSVVYVPTPSSPIPLSEFLPEYEMAQKVDGLQFEDHRLQEWIQFSAEHVTMQPGH
jgi:Carboxypeptidase regulatory-like domain